MLGLLVRNHPVPAPVGGGRLLPLPTPPGNRFAAHAPVVRIHLVDDDDRGSRIFPQDAHKQFRRPLDEFRFLLGGRRAVSRVTLILT